MIQRTMTAEEFSLNRAELPDAGQWAELIRGVPVMLRPPDVEHGTVVLNLSKLLSAYVHQSLNGYPCFDLGLQVEARPDTVIFPAISYFTEGERFSEYDKDYTTTVPSLVVELCTSSDRRQNINERMGLYLQLGIPTIWVIDPAQRAVNIFEQGQQFSRRVSEAETLRGDPILNGLQMKVKELFKEPDWA